MRNVLIAALLLTSLQTWAGAISGGGGKAVVCRAIDGHIISAGTLDLFEGRRLYGMAIPESTKTLDEVIDHAMKVIPAENRSWLEHSLPYVRKAIRLVKDIDLQPVDDALVIALPRGCQAEQAANYFNDDMIFVNQDIWDKMSTTEKAALTLHELFYFEDRRMGASNSMRIRHVIASLFAQGTRLEAARSGIPKGALSCNTSSDPYTAFEVYADSAGKLTLQFYSLGAGLIYSKKTLQISSDGGVFDFAEADDKHILNSASDIGFSTGQEGRTISNLEAGDDVTITKKWVAALDDKGNPIPGKELIRYFIGWKSALFPKAEMSDQAFTCAPGGQ